MEWKAKRNKEMKFSVLKKVVLAAAMSVGLAAAATNTSFGDADNAEKAAHEMRMYSRYTIWDNINLRVNNGNLGLLGQVSEPYKKADLQRLVQRIPGAASVTNELQVLPLSSMDNQLRWQVARAIYRDPVLSRYGLQGVPPIHIIVDRGHVTLEGVV